jgi:hypothetical protein
MFGHDNAGVKGHILVDGKQVAETHQCCHCGGHFIMRRGSGKVRGFCLKCQGPTCGAGGCDRCVPFEARLEFAEASHAGKAIGKLLARYPDLPLFPL